MNNFQRFYKKLLENKIDFQKFYNQILKEKVDFEKFSERKSIRYKDETLNLLKENIINKDEKGLSWTLAILFYDGADKDYTDLLLLLLDESWHTNEEDIVEVLELIKDPQSINKLYELAINVPDYDEMRALAKKAIRALGAINTKEAIEKLKLLASVDDFIIKENSLEQLKRINNLN